MRLNGVAAQSSAELGEIVQMIWLTPAMDRLFIESAGGRRRFLDRLVLGFDAAHARAATRYETAMRERARLLKYGPRDPAWLDGLENEMAEAGIAIAPARAPDRRTAQRAPWPSASAGRRFPGARRWRLTDELHLGSERRKPCATRLRRSRMRDAEARPHACGPAYHRSCRAPHRQARRRARLLHRRTEGASDLDHAGGCARAGPRPRRACAAAAAGRDRRPSGCDAPRRLFEEIHACRAQAWMTGTDLSLFEGRGVSRRRYLPGRMRGASSARQE